MGLVTFCGITDTGRVRTNNEDEYIIQYIWDNEHIIAVVIDGVGGYAGGEIAAATARKCIIEYLENYPNGERLELLRQAVISANNAILSERRTLPQYANMSCVLTAVLIELKHRRINMAHVGDTRLYQFSNGLLEKLSHDHSLVGYREEIGDLTEEEAMHHPQRNVISKDVGSTLLEMSDNNYIETTSFPLLSKSILLLCTDGLCDMLTSAQISAVLNTDMSVKDKSSILINTANFSGGKDNVTVVLINIDIDDDPIIKACSIGNNIPKSTNIPIATISQNPGTAVSKPCTRKNSCIKNIVIWITVFALGYLAGSFSAYKLFPFIFKYEIPVVNTEVTEYKSLDSCKINQKETHVNSNDKYQPIENEDNNN